MWRKARLTTLLFVLALPGAGAVLSVPNPDMPTATGGKEKLLAPEGLTVFIFFDPGGDHSREVLFQIAGIQAKMSEEKIHWKGILSDRFDVGAAAEMLTRSGADLDLLIDTGDRLYGQLKIRLYPTVDIADAQGVLHAYLPYTRANFDASLEAQLLHALGRIDDAQLAKALEPHAMEVNSSSAEAARMLKLAAILWKNDKREKAVEMAEKAVVISPESAGAQAALGLYLARSGQCREATAHLEKAAASMPENEEVTTALSHCRQGG